MQEKILTKQCSKCKIEKSSDMFNCDKLKKDLLRSQCKSCIKDYRYKNKYTMAEYKKLYYENNKEKILLQMKTNYDANRDQAIEYQRKYNDINRDAINEKNRQYANKNRDIINKKNKQYAILNKEKKAIYDRNYRIINKAKKDKYYQDNKELMKEKKSTYRKTLKGKASIKNSIHKRRTIIKQGDVSTEDILHLEQNTTFCYWCNKSLKNLKVHIDHYIPLSKGGEHTLSNLVVSCQRCNNQKHAKDPIEFANSIGKLL